MTAESVSRQRSGYRPGMSRAAELMRDWWLPVALTALTVADVSLNYGDRSSAHQVAMLTVLVPVCLLLAWRRRRPALTVVLAAGLVVVYVTVVQQDLGEQPPLEPFLALLGAYFSLGVHASRTDFVRGVALSAVLLLPLQVAELVAGAPVGDVLPSVLFWGTAAGAGRLLFFSRREATHERQRAAQAHEERELHAQRAAVDERSRIARELHDVVAHSLSVMVIHASVEGRLLDDQDTSTARTLRTIEQTGRDALVELRRLLGLLRSDDQDGSPLQPPPSLQQLDDLLTQLRGTGLDVELAVHGEPGNVPAGVDLSAYRIAQEALTNVLKHAPGAAVRVHLDYSDEAVTVRVEDDGSGHETAAPVHGPGNGLAGMRERVRLYGGRLDAGPRDGGGFRVRATMPTNTEAS